MRSLNDIVDADCLGILMELRCLKTVINPRSLISSSYADMLAALFIIVKTKINYSCPTGFFSINKAAGVSA